MPLAAMRRVVILVVLLNGHVGEVNERVVQLPDVRAVLHVAKARKTVQVLVAAPRSVGGNDNEETQIELLAAHKQWILDVAADDVGCRMRAE